MVLDRAGWHTAKQFEWPKRLTPLFLPPYSPELNPKITRASHVEPDAEGCWWADRGPVDGPGMRPYGRRSEALGAEREWLAARMP